MILADGNYSGGSPEGQRKYSGLLLGQNNLAFAMLPLGGSIHMLGRERDVELGKLAGAVLLLHLRGGGYARIEVSVAISFEHPDRVINQPAEMEQEYGTSK